MNGSIFSARGGRPFFAPKRPRERDLDVLQTLAEVKAGSARLIVTKL